MDDHLLSEFFEDHDSRYSCGDTGGNLTPGGDDLFSMLESLDAGALMDSFPPPTPSSDELVDFGSSLKELGGGAPTSAEEEEELETTPPKSKRAKLSSEANNSEDGQQRMSHIAVERNRRKQMNEHLTVLRSLMPCFYVKRGDQASIIGGVVDYINELQQVLQSLEAKKQRKAYSEVLSPRLPVSNSPRLPSSPVPCPVLSPRKPPLSPLASPRITCRSLPVSPRTPQPTSPYKPARTSSLQHLQQPANYLSSTTTPTLNPEPSSSNSSTTTTTTTSNYLSSTSSVNNHVIDNLNELFANSKSAVADVEVKFSGANVLLNTVSHWIPGQALKIISALEDLSLEILHVEINNEDEKMLNSFTIKIGIECQLSAEELAHQIQQTFC